MRAVVYHAFGQFPRVEDVPRVTPGPDDALVRVRASGICRSDWHGWKGHDPDIRTLPHVPGHEFAGVVEEVGENVRRWSPGQRVTAPFSCGCGQCAECASGNLQICTHGSQPGFTHWGALAEWVVVRQADVNLVAIPDPIDDITAACLGCRFATAYRAVVHQGGVKAGDFLAVYGCGGLGLSAIMIAHALDAQVIAVDIQKSKLRWARELGAAETFVGGGDHVVEQVVAATDGGAHVSIDALGSGTTCRQSLLSLRRRGRHVQAGLLVAEDADVALPLGTLIAGEREIVGSHGMPAPAYDAMIEMILAARLRPNQLVGKRLGLADAPQELVSMERFAPSGFSVVEF